MPGQNSSDDVGNSSAILSNPISFAETSQTTDSLPLMPVGVMIFKPVDNLIRKYKVYNDVHSNIKGTSLILSLSFLFLLALVLLTYITNNNITNNIAIE